MIMLEVKDCIKSHYFEKMPVFGDRCVIFAPITRPGWDFPSTLAADIAFSNSATVQIYAYMDKYKTFQMAQFRDDGVFLNRTTTDEGINVKRHIKLIKEWHPQYTDCKDVFLIQNVENRCHCDPYPGIKVRFSNTPLMELWKAMCNGNPAFTIFTGKIGAGIEANFSKLFGKGVLVQHGKTPTNISALTIVQVPVVLEYQVGKNTRYCVTLRAFDSITVDKGDAVKLARLMGGTVIYMRYDYIDGAGGIAVQTPREKIEEYHIIWGGTVLKGYGSLKRVGKDPFQTMGSVYKKYYDEFACAYVLTDGKKYYPIIIKSGSIRVTKITIFPN